MGRDVGQIDWPGDIEERSLAPNEANRLGRLKCSLAVTLAVGLAFPCPSFAQTVAPLSGRYRFTLTVSTSCPTSMQVGPLSVLMDVVETPVNLGSEVSGRSSAAFETPDQGRFVLLRQGTRVHGAFGASTAELGLDTEGSLRLWMQIMTDGTATTGAGGRTRASGTAFGEVELSLASDPTGRPTGNCQIFTPGYQWALEPA